MANRSIHWWILYLGHGHLRVGREAQADWRHKTTISPLRRRMTWMRTRPTRPFPTDPSRFRGDLQLEDFDWTARVQLDRRRLRQLFCLDFDAKIPLRILVKSTHAADGTEVHRLAMVFACQLRRGDIDHHVTD